MGDCCRYITRPAITNEQLKLNRTGDAVLRLKNPYRDSTKHITMPSLEFIQRLVFLRVFPQQPNISKQTLACAAMLTGYGRLLAVRTLGDLRMQICGN